MAYFDYLDKKVEQIKEFKAFEPLSNVSFWLSIGSLAVFIISCFLFGFVMQIGKNVFMGICPLVGLVIAIVGLVYAQKAAKQAKIKRIKHAKTNMSRALNLLLGLLCLVLVVANTLLWI